MIQRLLLRWYSEKGRDLPWRPPTLKLRKDKIYDPYKILVSEVMLQQTQVDRVIPKYQAFLKAFPTVEKLARSPRSRVIRLCAGLVYNRRAVYLHEAAKKVLRDFGGVVPTTIDELRTLPGVGAYTAGAVAAFAGRSTEAFLDTNIKRIIGRLFFNKKRQRLPLERELLFLAQSISSKKYRDNKYDDRHIYCHWHHALMDLGALVCAAAKPKCETCPLQRVCPFPPFRNVIKKSHYAKRQASFKDSDRFWRGRMIALARGQKNISLAIVQKILHIPHKRSAHLTETLVRDGLLEQRKGAFSLPH